MSDSAPERLGELEQRCGLRERRAAPRTDRELQEADLVCERRVVDDHRFAEHVECAFKIVDGVVHDSIGVKVDHSSARRSTRDLRMFNGVQRAGTTGSVWSL